MKDDLIFHLVTEKDFSEHKNNSIYTPQSIEDEGFIHCSSGNNIQETANRLFKGREDVMLLIINASLVDQKIKYEGDEKQGKSFPHIYGPISIRCIIDKIKLAPEQDGTFNISFKVEQ